MTANRAEADEPAERSPGDWLRLLRDGWIGLLVFVVGGLAAGALFTAAQQTEYEGAGGVVVSPAGGFLDPQDADALPRVTDTVERLGLTAEVLAPARRAFARSASGAGADSRERSATPEWMRQRLVIRQEADSSVISITARGGNQREADDLATAVSAALAQRTTAGAPRSGPRAGLEVHALPVDSAGRVSPTPLRNLALGANAGLLFGLVAALAVGTMRNRQWRPSAIADVIGAPLLGTVKLRERSSDGALPALGAVRTSLLSVPGGSPPRRVVLVTGTASPASIATVAVGLLPPMAGGGSSALLVDGDLQQRQVSRLLNVPDEPGLGETLQGGATPSVVIGHLANAAPGVSLIPAGRASTTGSLGANRLSHAIRSLRDGQGTVIIAGPPLSRRDDLAPLLAESDAVLIVATRGVTAKALDDASLLGQPLSDRLAGVLVVDAS